MPLSYRAPGQSTTMGLAGEGVPGNAEGVEDSRGRGERAQRARGRGDSRRGFVGGPVDARRSVAMALTTRLQQWQGGPRLYSPYGASRGRETLRCEGHE